MARRLLSLLCIGVPLLLLFIPGLDVGPGRLARALEDAAHFPLFALMTLGILGLMPRVGPAGRRAGCAAAATPTLVIVVEILQPLVNRDRGWGDLLPGLAGSAGVVALFLATRTRRRSVWGLVALAAVRAAGAPLGWGARDEWRERRQFPLLATFESAGELSRWDAAGVVLTRVTRDAAGGRYALAMRVTAADYPGIFTAPAQPDWADMEQLCMELALDAPAPRVIWLRMDDRPGNPPYAERFQVAFELAPGAHTVCVERAEFGKTAGGRDMDLHRIASFGIFLERGAVGDGLIVDNLRLVPRRRE